MSDAFPSFFFVTLLLLLAYTATLIRSGKVIADLTSSRGNTILALVAVSNLASFMT